MFGFFLMLGTFGVTWFLAFSFWWYSLTGSGELTVDPEGDNITLGLTIEQSDNLIEWTKLDGEMTRTIPIPDGKKFYRFALDK